jgi:butyryl-CoA dehydrogenase
VDLDLSEEQQLLQKSVRDFAEAEVKPHAKEIDETGHFPLHTFKKAAELGLTGVAVPENYGGAGMDHVSYAIVIEEISRVCASTGVILSVQNSLYCDPVLRFGTEEQKQKFLVPFARGEKIGCYALTEPQAGSNAAALTTKAVRKGDTYVINGTKAWITNGGAADAAIVYVNTQPEKGEKGITALVVEKGTRGFAVGKEEKKLGINATACTELSFTDCEVPVGNRIGNEGEGYKVALSTLDGGRIGIASQATGIAQGAFEAALSYAQQRQAFGHPISDFRPSSSCLPTWPLKLTPRVCLPAALRGNKTPEPASPWKPPSPSFSPAKCPRVWPTKPFRSTAVTATAANIPSNALIATRASLKFTKAPAKFNAWSSPLGS